MPISLIEWAGAVFGVLGAGLLALNMRHSGWGFVAFLVSNVCWIVYGVQTGTQGLVIMQGVFMVTSVLGVWRWLIADAR